MKITETHISIPPYISTTWENISSLHSEEGLLIFSLKDGNDIEVPHLSKEEVEQIFTEHLHFLEHAKERGHPAPQKTMFEVFVKDAAPSPMNLGALEMLGQSLAHNPKNMHLPPIPEEMKQKIKSLSSMMSEEELELLAPPEDNCMCLYCQIARTLRGEKNEEELPAIEEEKVSEAELKFEEWQVEHLSDKLYRVTNKLDKNESYTVFLGEPIGCTCGKSNCEHVVAALRS